MNYIWLYRYTMLLGRPPFETTNLKETYRCIREARYTMPSTLSPQAKHLISIMLAKSPEDRPSLDDILHHDFFIQVCVSLVLKEEYHTSLWSFHNILQLVFKTCSCLAFF